MSARRDPDPLGAAPARTQTKARTLLLTERGQPQQRTDQQIAGALSCSEGTVVTTRERFATEGLQAALYDKPRPGAKPKITGQVRAKLVTLACSEVPGGHARWTRQRLADQLVALGLLEPVSPPAVYERLKTTDSNLGR